MYFFYFDESGSRDPRAKGKSRGDHLYVLLALGMYEGKWHGFDRDITHLKLELADYARRNGRGNFELADCEVKSNWIRVAQGRARHSAFLSALDARDIDRLKDCFFKQIAERRVVLLAAVIDKRCLHEHMTSESLHKKAYEFILERIEHYMREYHRKHRALIIMDDTSKELNRALSMKHAYFQRVGNRNVNNFRHVVEYPFFTRSELSNGVQLADLLAYSVFRAFRDENPGYPYFARLLRYFYRRRDSRKLDGLKIWPETSTLTSLVPPPAESDPKKTALLRGERQ